MHPSPLGHRTKPLTDADIQRPGFAYPNQLDPHPFTPTPETGAQHLCWDCSQGKLYFLHDEPHATAFAARVHSLRQEVQTA